MSAQERNQKQAQVFELTYHAIGKAFHMSKSEIADVVASDSNDEISFLYFHMVRVGMIRYGLIPA